MNDSKQEKFQQNDPQVSDELNTNAQSSGELNAEELEAIAGGGLRDIFREVKNTIVDVGRALW